MKQSRPSAKLAGMLALASSPLQNRGHYVCCFCQSGKNFLHNLARHVGESIVTARMTVSEALVVDAEEM